MLDPYRFAGSALPLDGFTQVSAARSVARRLATGYTGALIRIRRSNDNAEQDIGYTGSNVLDTAAIATFVGSNSAYVTKIYDQSGNVRHLVQATAAAQPRLVNAGALDTKNSKPWAVFDGSNDALINSVGNSIENGSDVCWFFVSEVAIGRGGALWSIHIVAGSVISMLMVSGASPGTYSLTTFGSPAFAAMVYQIDQTSSIVPTPHSNRKNGTLISDVSTNAWFLRTPTVGTYETLGVLVGSVFSVGGHCEDVITTDTALSSAVRDAFSADQQSFYGL